MSKRRVVVTGLGMVSPVGLTVAENWKNIIAGKSGIGVIDCCDTDGITSKIAGSVKNFDATQYVFKKDIKKTDEFIHYAAAASIESLKDAALELDNEDKTRIGVAIGSGIGGLLAIEKNAHTMMEKGVNRLSPFFIPASLGNMASGYVSIQHGLQGPNICITTACTSGTHSIGYAARTIAYGDADVMVSGGAEMTICRLGLGGFAAMRALSTRNDEPQAASRPWDKDRDGFVMGAGAGVLILEEYQHAKARGAKIYAELAGFGTSGDAAHMTMNDQTGKAPSLCMNNALEDAQLNASDVNYINAHATSTPVGDPAEVKAISLSFAEHAKKLAISSTKSMTGHLLGAAGAIEAIYSVLAIEDQIAPPTINLDTVELGEELENLAKGLNFVAKEAQERPIKAVLSNSFGFGGPNGSLIFTKLKD